MSAKAVSLVQAQKEEEILVDHAEGEIHGSWNRPSAQSLNSRRMRRNESQEDPVRYGGRVCFSSVRSQCKVCTSNMHTTILCMSSINRISDVISSAILQSSLKFRCSTNGTYLSKLLKRKINIFSPYWALNVADSKYFGCSSDNRTNYMKHVDY